MMLVDETELKKIITGGESERVEFKPSLSQINEIVESVSAFANSSGGKIIAGVSNSGMVLGVEIGKDTLERLVNKITSNTEPKVYPSVFSEKFNGKNVVVIGIEKSAEVVLAFGRAFKRVGKSTVRMGREEYERRILERKKVYFDSQICEGAGLKDIEGEKIRWFLRKAKYERNLDVGLNIPMQEALEKLDLTADKKVTNAAVLLFGKRPQKFFLQAEVRCARFKGSEPVKPFLDMKVLGGTIYEQVDESEKFVLNNIKKAAWIEPGKIERQEKWEYPMDAVREAITNAICHRDYESTSNVQIRIFDDRLEVWNPGRLPDGWTVETLKRKHGSKPYNPLIAKLFFLVKYIEEWGTGTTDIVKDTIKHGLPEPLFEEVAGSIVITFRKYHITDEIIETLPEAEKRIVGFIQKKGSISRKECIELLAVSHATAFRYFAALEKKKILKRAGAGKNVRYVLA